MAEDNLLEKLQHYGAADFYPMHMPGHKRNSAMLSADLPYNIDITEIDGFDNLHQPEGILKTLFERIAKLYGSTFSVPLINGSTCGILAGIASVFSFGGSILMARNCHKSVYNAVNLLGLTPYYLVPPMDKKTGIAGSICPDDVQSMLEKHPDIQLVVLTSPTYDGVISDIKSIVELAHQKQVPVLVDEAHGAHLHFTKLAKLSAVACGADIVIQSLHKTLPAMTQTAVAHINGNLISPTTFLKQCAVFETSSPSYILLSSIDACVRFLEEHGEEVFTDYEKKLSVFSKDIKALSNLFVLCKGADALEKHPDFFAFDSGKLPIMTVHANINGEELLETLRTKYHIECEMASLSYALAMTSVCDSASGFTRLKEALLEIDSALESRKSSFTFKQEKLPVQVFSPFVARQKEGFFTDLKNASEKIALDFIFCYPPGIPILVPGEKMEKDILEEIKILKSCGLSVQSSDKMLPKIYCCD